MTLDAVGTAGGNEGRVATLVRAYLQADYRWEQAGEWHHLRIGEPAPAIEDAFPQAACFGLLSAWNPQSVPRADAENRADDEALHRQLLDSGLAYRPAFSSAHDRSWREPSWLVAGMVPAAFDALAMRFNQLGTLWWPRGDVVRLRIYAPGIASADPDGCVDWVAPRRQFADA